MNTRALLFSGGLDSFVAWRVLGDAIPVYVGLGHKYEPMEVETIERLEKACFDAMHVRYCGRFFLGDLEQPDGHIPLRNLVLLIGAAVETNADTLVMGALSGETSSDKSGWFFRQAQRQLSTLLYRPVKISTPFRGMTKTELVRYYLKRFPGSTNLARLKLTRSCYSNDAIPCGNCPSCFRRWVAMSLNGIEEVYQQPPWLWEMTNWKHRDSWWGYFKNVRVSEWYGVIRSNGQALNALRQVNRKPLQGGWRS